MFSFLAKFQHKQEMRESKDEILIGEIVRAMTRAGNIAIKFSADSGWQAVVFKPVNDNVLNTVVVILDRKTGDSAIQQAIFGSKATITLQCETKNYLVDPDDLIQMYKTDLKNIFKIPMLGEVKLDHQLNSILATKKLIIDIDNYILKGEQSVSNLASLLTTNIQEIRNKLAPYKKA